MIIASKSPDSFQTCGLYPETVLHLQRLVLLNADSRDAYRAASVLTKDARLIALAEYAHVERQIQAVTLQNVLWANGNESTPRICIETDDYKLCDRLRASPETRLPTIIHGLLHIDDYVYSCYEKVIGTIQGRGIRQLLWEQALQIDELRTTLTEFLTIIDRLPLAKEIGIPAVGVWRVEGNVDQCSTETVVPSEI